ncbi:ROK family protein [Gracilimonas mengyeensis]|uniref:Sugar kinase of the NBD/HSP70 family, may contain an N-terminal HTH domain n=1 Tax=Gracilimonas mengyeensis TaxID=1302730 RepID=A0A521EY81_9BACT|nr:ROK family protein [Gracilimonas mengyeensis]SMO88992.1 Sugar kinase of the NBD/HSP70 family, may contain an N-terminal HTH domain [Gracilimonas mengyeensis]
MNTSKIILTLDAGGTNFVFSAMRDHQEIVTPVTQPANAHDLERCLKDLVKGFKTVAEKLDSKPDAISFAFPGPADYPKGIIGNLPNFKAFNGDVALGPMLEHVFGIPVYINNDGDLFAYGEALTGILPAVNKKLEAAGSPKRFRNLVGVTIGTGFGGGIVLDGKLLTGDNSCGAEVHNTLNVINPDWNAEESISTRAVQRVYAEESDTEFNDRLMPGDIYKIAKGEKEGNPEAAKEAFHQLGMALGNSIANAATLIDGIVVIGGGLAAGWELFAPAMFKTLRKKYVNFKGEEADRLSFSVFDLEDERETAEFIKGNPKTVTIPGTDKQVSYDDSPRIGVGRSVLGTSTAVSMGAYTFALSKLAINQTD